MAKIRAYKLAEELGIERAEFVEKAAAAGVELKSAMAAIDDEQVALLREKLTARSARQVVSERRVEKKGGVVVRRRKRAAPEPPPPEEEKPEAAATIAEGGAALGELPSSPELVAPEPAPSAEEESAPEPAPEASPAEAQAAAAQAPARPSPPPEAGGAGPDRSGKQRKLVREVVNLREQERLARQATGARMRRQVTVDHRPLASPRRRRRDAAPSKPAAPAAQKEQKRLVRVDGAVSVGELARLIGAKAPEVQKKLMALGTMVSINQAIDAEAAQKVAKDFGYEVLNVGFDETKFMEAAPDQGSGALQSRPAVVTVMGHVDHGKTTLLDAIRRTKVVEGESGGMTQHVGAYRVPVGDGWLTFIDTPGHAAFTAMRARGAQATDIVVLVVAATEGIMPQTIEAIDHAKAAGVPILVAANKCDLPGANPQQTRQRLMEHDLVPEDFGGDVICVDISATKGTGLDKLLEMISLQSELLELKADPDRRASGLVLEARLDKGRGPVATVLIQEGTLRRGDALVSGTAWGRVRAMEDENGERLKEAGPSVPVQVIGLSTVPAAGEAVNVVENERAAKAIVDHREDLERAKPAEGRSTFTLDEFFARAEGGGVRELPVVIKGDVQGSVEALRGALADLSTDAVKVDVIHTGVGAVTETDVMLAKASEAIILAFHVRPDPAGRKAAESQGVDVRVYQIIYEVIDDVKKAMVGLLPPTISEAFLGRAEVRQTFTVPRIGTIAGSYVTEGMIRRGAPCRLLRDGVQVFEGKVDSLKRFKDDAREVQTGFECGIGIEGYGDVKIGDVIELYELEEKPATLQ